MSLKLPTKTSGGENGGGIVRTWRAEHEREAKTPKEHRLCPQALGQQRSQGLEPWWRWTCLQNGVTECGLWAERVGPEQKAEDGQAARPLWGLRLRDTRPHWGRSSEKGWRGTGSASPCHGHPTLPVQQERCHRQRVSGAGRAGTRGVEMSGSVSAQREGRGCGGGAGDMGTVCWVES